MVLVLGTMAGCGRIGFTERADANADAAMGPCDLAASYGAPVPLAGVSDPSFFEATMRMSTDELRGYLWSTGVGAGIELARATRPDRGSPFIVTPISELNMAASNEFEPTTSTDELVLIFQSNRAGGAGGLDLYLAQRATTAQPFTLVGGLPTIDTASDENQPFLTATSLYFVSNRDGDSDIYRAPRMGTTAFGTPVRVDDVSVVGANESDPVLSFDERTLYFGSNRNTGDIDIYEATRATTAEPFGGVRRVSELSSTTTDGPSWLSQDNCRLYMSSSILGTPDVYVATKP